MGISSEELGQDRRRAEAAAVAEIGRVALAGRGGVDLVATAADMVARILNADHCLLLEHFPESDTLVVRAASALPDLAGRAIPLAPDSLEAQAIRSEQPVIRTFAANGPDGQPWVQLPGLKAHSGMAVTVGGRNPFGVLVVLVAGENSVAPETAGFLQSVAEVLATALERQWLERQQVLQFAVNQVLVRSVTLESALPPALERICTTLDWDHGILWGVDPGASLLRCRSFWQRPGWQGKDSATAYRSGTFGQGEGLPGHVWATRAPFWLPDAAAGTRGLPGDLSRGGHVHGVLLCPIGVGDRVDGVMEFQCGHIWRPEQGLIDTISAIGMDIGQHGERFRTAVALREEREHLQTTLNTITDGVITTDEHGIIQTANLAAERVFGYRASELIGCNVSVLMPEPFRNEHDSHLRRYLSTGQSRIIGTVREVIGIRKDGSVFPMDLALGEMRIGAWRRFLGVVRDVTDRKAAEAEIRLLNADLEARVRQRTAELENAMQELEAFSYSVSHDLRSPLRTIDGFGQALEEDCGDELGDSGKDYLRRIRRATRHMGSLIDDLLRLSRVTRADLRREPVDLTELAGAVFAEHARQEPVRQVTVIVAPNMAIRGDEHLLRVALANLLGNAWKFTSRRAAATIEFGEFSAGGERIFFVRDNGVGFDMAFAGKLFGAFQRLHGVSEYEGSGIGLATVQRIIRRHGGRIWAEGVVDQGATFYFTLGKG